MKHLTYFLPKFASGIILCTLTMNAVLAQALTPASGANANDPARWYQEDLSPQARYQNSKKEADAAYKEAVNECKLLELSNRNNCIRDARAQLVQDIESAKKKMLSPTR